MTHNPSGESFPYRQARTRRFSLGVPRGFVTGVGDDGPIVLFLRTRTGDDPVTCLWRLHPEDGDEVCLVDPRDLGHDDADLPEQERSRRERAREQAGGITAFDTDETLSRAVFTVAGRLYTVQTASGLVRGHGAEAVFDPRISPDGRHVAYHAGDAVHVLDLEHDAAPRRLVAEDGVSWGRAEFVAAEEMGRGRGLWWSPDGAALAVTRVDERAMERWWIADPSRPETPPTPHHYPRAGGPNAAVSLWVIEVATAARREVGIDWSQEEYLAHVGWGTGPLTVLVQGRDQRRARILCVEPSTGAATSVREIVDAAWVELVAGTPAWAGDRLVTVEDRAEQGPDGTRVLCLDGAPVTPDGLQVRGVLHASAETVVFLANGDDPTQVHVHTYDVGTGDVHRHHDAEPGVHRAVVGPRPDAWTIEVSHRIEDTHPRVRAVNAAHTRPLTVAAADPGLTPRPRLLRLGTRRLAAALFLPSDEGPSGRLPVLLDPYGGPHVQRVMRAGGAHLTSQWLADQGFAVLVVDGRGSPGRGPAWERAVHGDLAGPVLEDQIAALEAAAEIEPRLDLDRVGIRGWSFGGFVAALAVLRRPDVFRAGIAGAPVTDWRLYDTHYTERYLGRPQDAPEAYERSGLVDPAGGLPGAADWGEHPPALQLIHGLADDNVVAAHSLRLSAALLASGRPHDFLPLSGVTHMTPQEEVAEHLLTGQVAFLRAALA